MMNKEKFFNTLFEEVPSLLKGFIETREFILGRKFPIRKFHKSIESVIKHIPEGDYYFGVCLRITDKNGKKENIRYITTLWVDIDYGQVGHKKPSKFSTKEEALNALKTFEFSPTLIVDSGGGLHSYWVLKEPEEIKDVEYIEGVLKGVTQHIGGDEGTHDITRILRAPGSNNLKIPDNPRPCKVIEFNEDARYNIEDFENYAVPISSIQSSTAISFSKELPKIDFRKIRVEPHIKKLIKNGNTEGFYLSRNECDLAVINALVQAGHGNDVIKAIFSNANNKISEKYFEKGAFGDNYLSHQIGKARALKENIDNINKLLKDGKIENASLGIDKLPEQYRKLYEKRLNQQMGEPCNIYEDKNRYLKIGYDGKQEKIIQISNFTLTIVNRFITSDECTREVYFQNIKGDKTKEFILGSQQMASLARFKEFCLAKGNFLFEGTDRDLMELWKLEFSKDEGKVIYQSDHLGFLKEHDIWLFNNCAIKNGKHYQPDDNGIIWIDGCGHKALSLNDKDVGELPALKKLSPEEMSEKEAWFVDKLKENVGGYEAWLAIGWIKAGVYSNSVFKALGLFPFLFIYGKTRSGKDTLAGWLLSLFGIMRTEGESLPEMTTPVGISRKGGYFSSLPVWLDEYRNDKKIIRFNGFFRNLVNRTGASKGRKTQFGTYIQKIRANFIFSGEQLPEDPALRNRCIPTRLSKNRRNDGLYDEINEISSSFSSIGLKWIMEKTDESTGELISVIKEIKQDLITNHGLDCDHAEIYAVPIAGFLSIRKDHDFYAWVVSEAKREKIEKKDADIINQFFDDLEGLHSKEVIDKAHVLYDNGEIYLWFNEVYRIWSSTFKGTGENPFPKSTILDYLKEEPYWIPHEKDHNGNPKTQKKLAGVNRRCIILDHEKAPASLKALIDAQAF